jgi:endonuclease/exonuclease/phosphatase family metal-dependent hydrolase
LSVVALCAVLVAAGCRTGRNYPAEGPRYAGGAPEGAALPSPAAAGPVPLRIVSFNIERALRIDQAIDVLVSDPGTRGADVLLLQEMDAEGTRRVARALGLSYVYYPGTLSFKTQRDFGNAVLSRWPIVADAKILLPHNGLLGRLQRTATAATLQVGPRQIRVYSTHFGTMLNVTPAAKRDQFATVLADADRHPLVVIGGDLNSHDVGEVARGRGYLWPTDEGPKTVGFGRWDHIFLRGLAYGGETGTVLDVKGASDHRAVWALAVVP